MQKEFRDIIERLEERKAELEKITAECKPTKEMKDKNYGYYTSVSHAIEIVNQVAEEYKSTEHINCSTDSSSEEVCEWKERKDRRYFPYKSSCGYRDLMNDDYVYCPYCGKKIKVIE